MKPVKGKRNSPYDNVSRNYFSTSSRKILGYLVMLCLFSLSLYWLGQNMRATPEIEYEMEILKNLNHDIDNVNNIVQVEDNDKDSNNFDLAGNMALGSKGDVGRGVNEAPKGGIANEAPLVGNNEKEVLEGKKAKSKPGRQVDERVPIDFEESVKGGTPEE